MSGIYQHSVRKWRPEHASSIPANVLPALCSSLLAASPSSLLITARWPDFKRKGATSGRSQPASCLFTLLLHFQLHRVLPRCPGCREGAELSTVWMWPGCYSIPRTSLPQGWFWGGEKVSMPLEVCNFVSLFTGGHCWDQPCRPCPLLSLPVPFPPPPRHVLVLKRWQPWLQDIVLKSSGGAGSTCREQRGGGEPGPSQAEPKEAEWSQVEQGGTV